MCESQHDFDGKRLMCLHIFLSARCAWLSDGCLCVCECTIWRWVFGCWYNQAIERCTQTEGPVGAMRKGRHCDYRCVCAAACVCVCAGCRGLRKCGGRKRKGGGRVFLSHRQSLLLSAVRVNEDL